MSLTFLKHSVHSTQEGHTLYSQAAVITFQDQLTQIFSARSREQCGGNVYRSSARFLDTETNACSL